MNDHYEEKYQEGYSEGFLIGGIECGLKMIKAGMSVSEAAKWLDMEEIEFRMKADLGFPPEEK